MKEESEMFEVHTIGRGTCVETPVGIEVEVFNQGTQRMERRDWTPEEFFRNAAVVRTNALAPEAVIVHSVRVILADGFRTFGKLWFRNGRTRVSAGAYGDDPAFTERGF